MGTVLDENANPIPGIGIYTSNDYPIYVSTHTYNDGTFEIDWVYRWPGLPYEGILRFQDDDGKRNGEFAESQAVVRFEEKDRTEEFDTKYYSTGFKIEGLHIVLKKLPASEK